MVALVCLIRISGYYLPKAAFIGNKASVGTVLSGVFGHIACISHASSFVDDV